MNLWLLAQKVAHIKLKTSAIGINFMMYTVQYIQLHVS